MEQAILEDVTSVKGSGKFLFDFSKLEDFLTQKKNLIKIIKWNQDQEKLLQQKRIWIL